MDQTPTRPGPGTFELLEDVQLDARSYIRILVGVLSFVVVSLLSFAAMALLPSFPFIAELTGIFILVATLGVSTFALRRFGPKYRQGARIYLSREEILVRKPGDPAPQRIANRNIRAAGISFTWLGLEDENGRPFAVPEFVIPASKAFERSNGARYALAVIDQRVRLVRRIYDADGLKEQTTVDL
jgi:hypothetical protein